MKTAKYATLGELRNTILAEYIQPIPSNETLRAWFDDANIPRIKTNRCAKRGGGPVFYSVAAIEQMFKDAESA